MNQNTNPEELFLKAYEGFGDSVFRHCYLRVSPREEAVDITQEAFMKVWDYLRTGQEVHNMKAFVFKTVNNLIIDWYRKKKPVTLDDEEALRIPDTLHATDPELAALGREALTLLARLDGEYRTVVELRIIEGFGPKEIAEILGETENAVSVRIHRGIAKLRELYESSPE
ncbi:sigma-70 family RNA polymerase sigma factor [Candidatus Wolfebacteria bacterium]|nr:sigma-70 family RNA polymerase sigma factor [Candidatus Wolfebacteria bacterium]